MSTVRVVVLVAMTVALAAHAEIGPLGGDLQANTYTPGSQRTPSVAMTPSGGFVVVWESQPPFPFPGQDGSESGVYGQRYDADGARLGSEFRVNLATPGTQRRPSIGTDAAGRFVVAFESYPSFSPPFGGGDGSLSGAFLRLFDADGTPRSGDLLVNTYTRWNQNDPQVAVAPDGTFVVAWTSGSYRSLRTQDGDGAGVFAQRFDASGARTGGELLVNSLTLDDQLAPAVAIDPNGSFVVAWQSGSYYADVDGDASGIFARRFDAAGVAAGPEFQVNTYTTSYQLNPAIAVQPGGGFVVAWESGTYYTSSHDGSGAGVFAQRFDASGARLGPEMPVNGFTLDNQSDPAIAVDRTTGNFVVTFDSGGYGERTFDGEGIAIAARHFTADGLPLGDDVLVNTYTTGRQWGSSVAADGTGRFVVSWTSGRGAVSSQDGHLDGAFSRRFRTTAFTAPEGVRGARLRLVDHATDPTRRRLTVRTDDAAVDLGAGAGSLDDPTVGGALLRVRGSSFDDTYVLPAGNWRATRQGWMYRDPRLLAGPISRARIRAGRLASASGLGAQLQHTLATSPEPVDVILQTGDAGQRWCMTFGGATRFVPGRVFTAFDAPAPARGGCTP